MARGGMDQWNLRFGISWNAGGYTWQKVPTQARAGGIEFRRRLAPAGAYQEEQDLPSGVATRITATAGGAHTERRNGLAIARKAYREFKTLARKLRTGQERYNAIGMAAIGRELTQVERAEGRRLTSEMEQQVVGYANDFGTLWGDGDPRTLDDWTKEAIHFLDAVEIAEGMSIGKDQAFRSPEHEGSQLIIDGSTIRLKTSFNLYTMVTKGSWVEAGDAAERVEWFERLMIANPRQRARFLFRKIINQKLDGGLSLEASLLSRDNAVIAPKRLVDLLYVRLWLDMDRTKDPVRTCEMCGTELEGKQRRFCSQAHKQKHYRRKVA